MTASSPPDPALAQLRAALRRAPRDAALHNDLANRLLAAGDPAAAVRAYGAALRHAPEAPALHFNLANALAAAGDTAAAEPAYRRALALAPQMAGAHNNLGNLLRRLHRPAEALECYRRALFLAPDGAATRYNLGTALLDLGRAAEAILYFEKAARATPPHGPAFASLGEALLRLGRRQEALAQFRLALRHRPDDAPARMGEAVCLLAAGDYPAGFAAFEARLADARVQASLPAVAGPRLRPEHLAAIAGQSVAVLAEQGAGDTIQFARYLPLLRARGAVVTLVAPPPLLRLLAPLADAALPVGTLPPPPDFVSPIMSLAHVFATTLATVPAAVPYLAVPDGERRHWEATLGPRTRRRIGLAWSGNPTHMFDADRSLPAATLAPLLALDAEFHAVQTPVRATDLPLDPRIHRHDDALPDFAATAGLIAAMDAVVSVDTAAAHLAGALACPLHLLLSGHADFRWLEGRTDSPWYPTARLWRRGAEAWSAVLGRLATALAA